MNDFGHLPKSPKAIGFLGTSGAGKTTLAKEVAQRLDSIFIEHDALRHQANWTTASTKEVRQSIEKQILGKERWVIDRVPGAYLSERLDVIVWLDLPLAIKFARAARRSWRRLKTKEALWNGNRETWQGVFLERDGVLPYLICSHFRQKRAIPKRADYPKVLRLRTRQEVHDWLEKTFPKS